MEDYEKLQEKNEKRNKKYLNAFENYLKNQGLTTKTINKHLSNVDFYLNDYLFVLHLESHSYFDY